MIDLKASQCRGNNPEHNITKYLFTPDLRRRKRKKVKKEDKIS